MTHIDDLIAQIRGLEEELQIEFDKKRDDFRFVLDKKRVRFSQEILELQRRSKVGVFRFIARASILNWLAALVIYSGLVPMLMLDVFLFFYQAICFTAYHIPKAKRSDYVVLDRGDLPYLNAIEKVNCLYCGYGNGLAAYFREISARTEQYWCPIKHARRIAAAHDLYPSFFEYGDAESYRLGLERLRKRMTEPAED